MSPVILTAAQNTFVSSAQPNDTFSFYPLLYTGTDELFGTCISLLKFDFTTIAANAVDSAFLQLTAIVKTGEAASTIVVNRVTESFDASYVTYDRMPGIAATPSEITLTSEELYKTVQIDITQLVNDWLGGVHVNHGLALTNSDGVSLVQFGSDKIVWEPYFPKLVLHYTVTPPETAKAYGYIYNTVDQSIIPGNNISFSSNGFMEGVSHTTGSDSVILEEAGTYAVWFSVSAQKPNQFALFLNDSLIPGSIYSVGLSDSANIGMALISAQSGYQLTVRNYNSLDTVPLSNGIGGLEDNVTASVFVWKVGPPSEPLPTLEAVNRAQTEIEMRIAVADPVLALDLSAFDAISGVQQTQVLTELIAKRPPDGYEYSSEIQAVLDHAIEYSVDYANLYVDGGAADGIGNQYHPLGTIEQALSVLEADGTLHLTGTLEAVNTINITKAGITLLGHNDPQIIAAGDSIPVIVNAPGVTLNGISIVNIECHPTELIRILSSDAKIVNCNLSGPGKTASLQLLAGISAVEEGAYNYIIENNRIKSLDTGILLMEFSYGIVTANNISDTRCGISIDGGISKIAENSWLGLSNDADIVITAQTPSGPPYDDIEELSIINNDAVVIDERVE